ncbi:hypothetical protein G9A89_022719 [Geosiphon pyriformis]|nr:hypothetical protein G9A89_022719 [Geosiphon pyriformis]
MQQQPLQLPPQQPNLDPIAYIPIAKLDNFTSKENDTQIWLNDIEKAISLATKLQTFNEFKTEFLKYFSNNNSINHLINTFTTIKQGDTEAVTTYLGHFHRNLCQIQAIQADYFTAPQILNQFIRGLCSSIFQQVRSMHLVDLPTTITHARDFKAAELKANHTQAVNLVMNRSSDLDSKLKQFSNTINQKLEGYLANNHPETHVCHNCGKQDHIKADYSESLPKSRPISNHLPANNAATNLSTVNISTSNLSTPQPQIIYQLQQPIQTPLQNSTQMTSENPRPRITQNWKSAIVWNPDTGSTQNLNSQNYLSLLVTPEDATTNNSESNPPQTTLTNNIPPAMVTENESLAAIFFFKLEKTINSSLFSGAALEKKPITMIYTDAKVDGHFIKLILDSGLASSIITKQLMDQLANGVTKTPIGEIDDFPIEVNGIIVPIKNGRHIWVLATCGHFKPITTPSSPLIKFEEGKAKPIWEAYQVLWANVDHNKLLPILAWDNNNNRKEKQREELTWEATINT